MNAMIIPMSKQIGLSSGMIGTCRYEMDVNKCLSVQTVDSRVVVQDTVSHGWTYTHTHCMYVCIIGAWLWA